MMFGPRKNNRVALSFCTVVSEAAQAILRCLGPENTAHTELINRHLNGDWGCVSVDQALRNERELSAGGAVASCFRVALDIWVTTQNGVTTVIAAPAQDREEGAHYPGSLYPAHNEGV